MEIDRELQLRILCYLKQVYPHQAFTNKIDEAIGADHADLCNNAAYLIEHELVTGSLRTLSDGTNGWMPGRLQITASGLDFLEEDGGLSAILGVVTVRLHADSIRDLIAAQIEQSDLDSSAKSKLKEAVRNLPAKGLEEVVSTLTREGLARMPNAIHWLQTQFFP